MASMSKFFYAINDNNQQIIFGAELQSTVMVEARNATLKTGTKHIVVQELCEFVPTTTVQEYYRE